MDELKVNGGKFDPIQQIDLIPELEKEYADNQAADERYFQQLKDNDEKELRNLERTWSGIGNLSSTLENILKKKKEEYRNKRQTELNYLVVTDGLDERILERFRGERKSLEEGHLDHVSFAQKWRAETGDFMTAKEFENLSGWEETMLVESFIREEAKKYDAYFKEKYNTETIEVLRNGVPTTLNRESADLTLAEERSLDGKIKYKFMERFGGIHEAFVAEILKPELDKSDEQRRRTQAAKREQLYSIEREQKENRDIETNFIQATTKGSFDMAHRWVEEHSRYHKIPKDTSRAIFKDKVFKLVESGLLEASDVQRVVNDEHETSGGIRSLSSWKGWDDFDTRLNEAAVKGLDARKEKVDAQTKLYVDSIRDMVDPSDDVKAQVREIIRANPMFEGKIPSEIEEALAGRISSENATKVANQLKRDQDGIIYEFQAKSFPNELYNNLKNQKVIVDDNTPLLKGSANWKITQDLLKFHAGEAYGQSFGEEDSAHQGYIVALQKLERYYNESYAQYMKDNPAGFNHHAAHGIAMQAVERAYDTPEKKKLLLKPYWQEKGFELNQQLDSERRQQALSSVAGGKWRSRLVAGTTEQERADLIAWYQSPEQKVADIPEFYRDMSKAMRFEHGPEAFAKAQAALLLEEEPKYEEGDLEKAIKKKKELNKEILELLSSSHTTNINVLQARILFETDGDPDALSSFWNSPALTA